METGYPVGDPSSAAANATKPVNGTAAYANGYSTDLGDNHGGASENFWDEEHEADGGMLAPERHIVEEEIPTHSLLFYGVRGQQVRTWVSHRLLEKNGTKSFWYDFMINGDGHGGTNE